MIKAVQSCLLKPIRCRLSRKTWWRISFLLLALTLITYVVLDNSLMIIYHVRGFLAEKANSTGHKIHIDRPCIIPRLNPWHEAIKKFMLPPMHIDCTYKNHPLIFSTDLDSNLVVIQDSKKFGYEKCCYTPFVRDGGDRKQLYSSHCYPIQQNQTHIRVPSPHEFIAIYCKQSRPNWNFKALSNWVQGRTVLVDMLHFVRLKPEAETRATSFHKQKEGERTPNIVILGLDSVSHMNFIRMMPKSHAFITKNLSAIGMNGYSIFQEETFANLVPALTGMKTEELKLNCWRTKSEYFDDCPFVWKELSRNGYLTSYAEDSTDAAIFLYHKKGFKHQPTDYYLITLLDAMVNKTLDNRGNSGFRSSFCYGPRPGVSILLNNIKKVMHTMGESRKYFQFTWVTSLGHVDQNLVSSGDDPLMEFLQWALSGKYLSNTIFILMSDHGTRYNHFRQSEQGSIEARMPFLYFVFPEWFSQKYTAAVANVRLNQDRLTTPLDLHETLQDLTNLSQIENRAILKRSQALLNMSPSIPRAISLFLPLGVKRSCQDADIGMHACACSPPPPMMKNDTKVLQAAEGAVAIINKMLSPHHKCAPLSLGQVIKAYEIFNLSKQQPNFNSKLLYDEDVTFVIMITFKTSPSQAIFEATLIETKDKRWTASGEISLISKYGNQSHCISDYKVKSYCYCS